MHKVRTLRRREATERVDFIFMNAVLARPWDGPKRAWTDGCWESHSTPQVLKTRGETGVQCSGCTLAQQGHDCRS